MTFSMEGGFRKVLIPHEYDFFEVMRIQTEQRNLYRKIEARNRQFQYELSRNADKTFQFLINEKEMNKRRQLAKTSLLDGKRSFHFRKATYHNANYQTKINTDGSDVLKEVKIKTTFPRAEDQKQHEAHEKILEKMQVECQKTSLGFDFKQLYELNNKIDPSEVERLKEFNRIRDSAKYLISGDHLESMEYREFLKLIESPGVAEQLSLVLVETLDNKELIRKYLLDHMKDKGGLQKLNKNKNFVKQAKNEVEWMGKNKLPKQIKVNVIQRLLEYKDRSLLSELKNQQLTFSQVIARMNEKFWGCKYFVLDDVKKTLVMEDGGRFKNEAEFKAFFNRQANEEVPIEEVVNPNNYFKDKKCQRSVVNSKINTSKQKAKEEQFKMMQLKIGFGTKIRDSNSADGRKRAMPPPQYHVEDESEGQYMIKAVEAVLADLSKQEKVFANSQRIQSKINKEIRSYLERKSQSASDLKVDFLVCLVQDNAQKQAFSPRFESMNGISMSEKLNTKSDDSDSTKGRKRGLRKQRDEILKSFDEIGKRKLQNQTDKRAILTRDRIERDFYTYRNLQFLKKLELDNQHVTWNPKQKRIFQRVEKDNERFRLFQLGIDKEMKTDHEKYIEQNKKKPRPMELMTEKKMVGKWGTQKFSREKQVFSCLHQEESPSTKAFNLNELNKYAFEPQNNTMSYMNFKMNLIKIEDKLIRKLNQQVTNSAGTTHLESDSKSSNIIKRIIKIATQDEEINQAIQELYSSMQKTSKEDPGVNSNQARVQLLEVSQQNQIEEQPNKNEGEVSLSDENENNNLKTFQSKTNNSTFQARTAQLQKRLDSQEELDKLCELTSDITQQNKESPEVLRKQVEIFNPSNSGQLQLISNEYQFNDSNLLQVVPEKSQSRMQQLDFIHEGTEKTGVAVSSQHSEHKPIIIESDVEMEKQRKLQSSSTNSPCNNTVNLFKQSTSLYKQYKRKETEKVDGKSHLKLEPNNEDVGMRARMIMKHSTLRLDNLKTMTEEEKSKKVSIEDKEELLKLSRIKSIYAKHEDQNKDIDGQDSAADIRCSEESIKRNDRDPGGNFLDLFRTVIDLNNLTDDMKEYLYGDKPLFNSKNNRQFITETLAALNQGKLMTIVNKNPAELRFQTRKSHVFPNIPKDSIQIPANSNLRKTLDIQKQIGLAQNQVKKTQNPSAASPITKNSSSDLTKNKITFTNFTRGVIHQESQYLSMSPLISTGEVTQKHARRDLEAEKKQLKFSREIETAEGSPLKVDNIQKGYDEESHPEGSVQQPLSIQEGQAETTKTRDRIQTACNTARNANLLGPLRESSKQRIAPFRQSMLKSPQSNLISSGTTAHLASNPKLTPRMVTSNAAQSTNCFFSQQKQSLTQLSHKQISFRPQNSNKELVSTERILKNAFPTRKKSAHRRHFGNSQQPNFFRRQAGFTTNLKPVRSGINQPTDVNILIRGDTDNENTNSNDNPLSSNADLLCGQLYKNPSQHQSPQIIDRVTNLESCGTELLTGDFAKFVNLDFLSERQQPKVIESSQVIQERTKHDYVSYRNKRLLFSRQHNSQVSQEHRLSTEGDNTKRKEQDKHGKGSTVRKLREESAHSQPSKDLLQSFQSKSSCSQLIQPRIFRKHLKKIQPKKQENRNLFSPVITRDALIRQHNVPNRLINFLAKNNIPVADHNENEKHRVKYVLCGNQVDSRNQGEVQSPSQGSKYKSKKTLDKAASPMFSATVSPSGSTNAVHNVGESVDNEVNQPSSIVIRRNALIAQYQFQNDDVNDQVEKSQHLHLNMNLVLKQPGQQQYFGGKVVRNALDTKVHDDFSQNVASIEQQDQTLIGMISSPTVDKEMLGITPRMVDGNPNIFQICNASFMEANQEEMGGQSSINVNRPIIPFLNLSEGTYIGASRQRIQSKVSQSQINKILNQNSLSSEPLIEPTVQKIQPTEHTKRKQSQVVMESQPKYSVANPVRTQKSGQITAEQFPFVSDLLSSHSKKKESKRNQLRKQVTNQSKDVLSSAIYN